MFNFYTNIVGTIPLNFPIVTRCFLPMKKKNGDKCGRFQTDHVIHIHANKHFRPTPPHPKGGALHLYKFPAPKDAFC